MILIYIAFTIAILFSMNIGASGAAASMGIAYGSGAVKKKKWALWLSGIGVLLGASIGGTPVMKTIGSGIIPTSNLSIETTIVILAAATLSLFFANMIGIPLSTSEITVGSLVGVGLANHTLYFHQLIWIIAVWVIVPIISFIFAYFFGHSFHLLEKRFPTLITRKVGHLLKWLTIGVGLFEAFSAGMNNVANSVGSLVGAGIVGIHSGLMIGGIFVAAGAILFGGKVLDTNGKKITTLSPLQGIAISATSAILVTVASIFGFPVPMTQITTTGILGMGTADQGFRLLQKNVIQKMITVWYVSPIFSMVVSYSLINLFILSDVYSIAAIISMFFATIGIRSLIKLIQKEKRSIHEQGGGI